MEKRENSMTNLEEVPCDLCGSAARKTLYDKRPFGIVQCSECGLVYVSPRLPACSLKDEVYDEAYFDAGRGYGLANHFGEGRREAMRRAKGILGRGGGARGVGGKRGGTGRPGGGPREGRTRPERLRGRDYRRALRRRIFRRDHHARRDRTPPLPLRGTEKGPRPPEAGRP